MAYTLQEWIAFCRKDLSRTTVIELPVTKEAMDKAVAGNKRHCTIANAFSAYTGMDPASNQIEVTAQYIKFVVQDIRYFLVHEVVGAEHIKQLDSLAQHENGPDPFRAAFEPFVLKLRAHDKRAVYVRASVKKPVMAKKNGEAKIIDINIDKAKETDSKAPTANGVIAARQTRKDTGAVKSRWAL